MSGGYAIMTFRTRGNCGRSNKTFNDLFGSKYSPANKIMAGGGMQKHATPSSIGRQNYIFNHILRNTSTKPKSKSKTKP